MATVCVIVSFERRVCRDARLGWVRVLCSVDAGACTGGNDVFSELFRDSIFGGNSVDRVAQGRHVGCPVVLRFNTTSPIKFLNSTERAFGCARQLFLFPTGSPLAA